MVPSREPDDSRLSTEFINRSRRFILHAVDSDSNPKRKRGTQILSSLTLRVTMECAIFHRERIRQIAHSFTIVGQIRAELNHNPLGSAGESTPDIVICENCQYRSAGIVVKVRRS